MSAGSFPREYSRAGLRPQFFASPSGSGFPTAASAGRTFRAGLWLNKRGACEPATQTGFARDPECNGSLQAITRAPRGNSLGIRQFFQLNQFPTGGHCDD